MNCLKPNIIQMYMDGETSQKEVELIEKHLSECNDCKERLKNQRFLSEKIKSAMNLLVKDPVEIPEWSKPVRKTRRLTTAVVSAISATCVVVIILLFAHPREQINIARIGVVPEVNANKPASAQDMVIQVIDEKGNITEYDLK